MGYVAIPFIIAVLIVLVTLLAVVFILFAYLGEPGAFAMRFSQDVDLVTVFFLNPIHYALIGFLGTLASLGFAIK